ncbi:hypothetical protein GOP47_0006726 [Adiantum capillus-veneris]|uniref:Uncharacterized protein n=1 Tax=Adiantum capillus-veneris TaxID=13818 RepID=A0A9D4V3Z5_ADICA|nr:hypothetical protein GOP47_0006726 [Adiantum capillus-veneris]
MPIKLAIIEGWTMKNILQKNIVTASLQALQGLPLLGAHVTFLLALSSPSGGPLLSLPLAAPLAALHRAHNPPTPWFDELQPLRLPSASEGHPFILLRAMPTPVPASSFLPSLV